MLKDAFNFAKQIFALTRDTQQNKAAIADLGDEVKDLRAEMN